MTSSQNIEQTYLTGIGLCLKITLITFDKVIPLNQNTKCLFEINKAIWSEMSTIKLTMILNLSCNIIYVVVKHKKLNVAK